MPKNRPLLAAVVRILRALVRILLRHGVPYPVFSELARWTYADVAAREFALPGRKQTQSRISVLTGLSRKEVHRLLHQPPPDEQAEVERFHRASRIVSAWTREPRYRDEHGEPLPLPFDGDGPTFSELVSRFGADVPPRAVLDELLTAGTVAREAGGALRLRTRAYVPSGAASEPARLAVLGADVAALLETIDHNLGSAPPERWFQRHVAYRGLDPGAAGAVRDLASLEGQRVLEILDRVLADKVTGDPVPGGATKRVLLGIYWHEADEPADGSGEASGSERSS
ncbi:MAG: DUF6502 family protein [Deferrisomatales bacterium]